MLKKFSVLALAGLLAVPAMAMASAGPNAADLEKKVEELSKQLDELKAALDAQREVSDKLTDSVEDMDERSADWDLAARIKFFGDFRTRLDYYSADTVFGRDLDNDTIWTNRFRLNMRVHATENVEFKGRLAMYKTWGNQSAFTDDSGAMWPVFDGNVTRTPAENSALYVDRAYLNWNNIAGQPMWLSVGRRPTTDGQPAQERMGVDGDATPMAFMDWPFDGLTLGYAWTWGPEAMGDSRMRFCYGRGFEAGLQDEDKIVGSIDDMDFAGISWDVMKKDEMIAYLQVFNAFNVINYPNFQDPIIDSMFGEMSGMGARKNLGDILHTSAIFHNKTANVHYFLAGGWSQTNPDADGMFNDYAAMAAGMAGPNTDDENGYSIYAGMRYDMDNIGLKLGAEFNYGSENWLAMSPGHDEIYQSKLATRGQVYEVYGLYDLPTGEFISKYAKTFIRFGYQHYEYDYSGSGDWNMAAYDLSDAGDRMKMGMMGLDPVENADQIYLTFEAFF
ncbi:DUF3373 domain-containing protein [Desulfoprunum benzoelyticum]|uniref:DUF3373 domain-containing protein n=1 Tax=Desulfoprunum benzoelyticum TaxID=1506996 RepID=A0A840UR33_9BACT|nr:DUF3373 family protein [Desulfoprunum benzoelyticum]MBB5348105.1 hypothetical protein [Desulfoprunum benzoelyticum]MBM9530284.1 DUF3373 domain-containing protein [Desulfoprunum benzoelyticum]